MEYFRPGELVRNTYGELREDARTSSPVARAWTEWLQHLARTIKTCRLYDANNPTATTFRRDLAASLAATLAEHGTVELGFTPDEITLGETPLYGARSREDNLSMPFYRDGIRSMTIMPGVEPQEVDALLDAMLVVTRLGHDEADLVTLLWEKELEHIFIQYVSTEGDVETGGDGPLDAKEPASGSVAPWPAAAPGSPSSSISIEGAPSQDSVVDDTGRSDDRITAGRARDVEAALIGLEIAADSEVERLLEEHHAEQARPLSRRVLDLMAACFTHATRDGDRRELRQFLPRLLHDSVSNGDWREARECLYLLRDPGAERDPVAQFANDLARPDSITSKNAWKCLDHQAPEQTETFFDFARELGPDATDWLMRGIAESQRQGLRKGLARVLAGIVADNPERLAPWLSDERWYVVRNVIHILGLMDGPAPIGLLRSVSKHHEFRVRREVVSSLGRVSRELARPLLLEMLKAADTRLYGTILHHLSTARDPELAAMLFEELEDDAFGTRPEDERRAVYQALAAVGGDAIVPLLEAHVLPGNWFAAPRGQEASRLAAVMCLARIGTPAARAILERGAKSRRTDVARPCSAGLAAIEARK